MNIYDFARQFEEEKELFYVDLQRNTNHPGLVNILAMLAAEERNHAELMLKLKNSETNLECAETTILKDAKKEFAKMNKENMAFDETTEELELYKKAWSMEKDSENFYKNKVNEIESARGKSIFIKLAQEEAKHVHLMENLVEFISRPKTWIEDAEFYHLDEY